MLTKLSCRRSFCLLPLFVANFHLAFALVLLTNHVRQIEGQFGRPFHRFVPCSSTTDTTDNTANSTTSERRQVPSTDNNASGAWYGNLTASTESSSPHHLPGTAPSPVAIPFFSGSANLSILLACGYHFQSNCAIPCASEQLHFSLEIGIYN